MDNPTLHVVNNPMHPSMPDWLRRGEYLVIVRQDGETIGLASFKRRQDAVTRACVETRQNARMGRVCYACGFWHQHDDGTWAVHSA